MTDAIIRPPDMWEASEEGEQETESHTDSFFGLFNFLLRHRWRIALGALLFAAIAVPIKLTSPRTYTSTSLFVSESSRGRISQLSGLAAQVGVSLGAGGDSYSPQFYIDLIQSPVVLGPAVENRYTFVTGKGLRTASLIEYYETQVETPDRSRELAIRELQSSIRANLYPKTGVVQISVKARNADLSAQIHRKLLELLDRFNTETRRTRATAERGFIEGRMRVVSADLRADEARVEEFLRRNRQWRNSPELTFEYERLSTAVSVTRQVYNSLAQSLEQAKIDEIRNTPVLTVVQPPAPPPWPDARGTIRAGVLALLLGAIAGLGLGFFRDQWRLRVNAGTDEYQQFRGLVSETRYDLRTLFTLGFGRKRYPKREGEKPAHDGR